MNTDPDQDVLRLSRRHLDVLRGAEDVEAIEELRAAGWLDDEGLPTDEVAATVAHVLLDAEASVTVRRASTGERVAVELRTGPAGTLAMPAGGPDDEVEVALTSGAAFARTLWRLLQLGPRAVPRTGADIGDAAALGAPFDRPGEPGWLGQLDTDPDQIALTRVALQVGAGPGAPVVVAVADDGVRVWEVTGDDDGWHASPTSSVDLWRTFAGWQRGLLDRRDSEVAELPDDVEVTLDGGNLRVAAGSGWEAVAGGGPGRMWAWRAPVGEGMAPNVTVAASSPPVPDLAVTAPTLAAGLSGGRVIAVDAAAGTVVLVHAAPAGDAVTAQRYVPVGDEVAIVSYTVSAEASYVSLPVLLDALATLTPAP